jgi:hypothetical protein
MRSGQSRNAEIQNANRLRRNLEDAIFAHKLPAPDAFFAAKTATFERFRVAFLRRGV